MLRVAKIRKFYLGITLLITCVFFVVKPTYALNLNWNQDFSGFTNGSLDGQGSWSASNTSVSNYANCMNDKCIYPRGASSVYAYYYPQINLLSLGDTVSFYQYLNNTTPTLEGVYFYANGEEKGKGGVPITGNLLCSVIDTNGTIKLNNVPQMTITTPTYIYSELQFDNFQEKCRLRLNNSIWSEWVDYMVKEGDNKQTVDIAEVVGDNNNSYFDNLYVYKSAEHISKDLNNFYIEFALFFLVPFLFLIFIICVKVLVL